MAEITVASRSGLIYVERVRDDGEASSGDRNSFLQTAADLPSGGPGFGRRLVGLPDQAFPRGWMSPRAIAVSSDGERWAAAAFLSHTALGLSDAFDGSAIDGRNLFWENEDLFVGPLEQLVVGSMDGSIAPVVGIFSGAVHDVGFLPDGRIVTLEWLDERYHIVITDPIVWSRRSVGSIDSTFARISIHPEGRWILVSSSPPSLIDTETGLIYRIDASGWFAWWPQYDSDKLIGCGVFEGGPRLVAYDLGTASLTDLGPLAHTLDIDPLFWVPKFLQVNRDGAVACISGVDLDPSHTKVHGDGGRAHILDVESRTLEPVGPTFVDPGDRRFLRLHEGIRWTSNGRTRPLLPESLGLQDPTYMPQAEAAGRSAIWEEANDLIVKSMVAMNSFKAGQVPVNSAALGAFLPAALRCLRAEAPELFHEVSQWGAMVASLSVVDVDAAGPGWRRSFVDEFHAIAAGTDGPPRPLAPEPVAPSPAVFGANSSTSLTSTAVPGSATTVSSHDLSQWVCAGSRKALLTWDDVGR